MNDNKVQSRAQSPAEAEVVSEKTTPAVSPRKAVREPNIRPPHRQERKRHAREDRARSEFAQKLLNIRRVTRVAAGGRRFSFSVALVLGDRKGSVGVGTGKAADTALAIEKATRDAKKNLLKLALTKNHSLPYEVETKYSSARVLIMPAPRRGLVAGSAVRDVLELGGVRDVVGKIMSGSKNKLNIAQATIKALREFGSRPSTVALAESALLKAVTVSKEAALEKTLKE